MSTRPKVKIDKTAQSIYNRNKLINLIGDRKMDKQNPTISGGFKDFSYKAFKRIIDILGGIVGCIILIPVLIAVKIAFCITGDWDKLIFTQERIG